MSCNYIIDTYAWIEYFKASKMGEAAKEFIESENSVTPTIVVSEISRKLRKDIELGNETREGRLRRLEFIRATSRIVDLDFEIAIEAGGGSEDLKVEAKGWGLADSIVLCTARSLNGKVVTGDEHFRHLENVVFVKT
ncbi:MAG: type II toxin-antitoxin system VapC family toxin [Candidatus Bathyarchaeia archaeon]|jgi:predicted nucleic acid-binding protein